jgi:hypothetical protein
VPKYTVTRYQSAVGQMCCKEAGGRFDLNALNNFFVIPFYLQSVQVHSANCVNIYTVACRREFSNLQMQLFIYCETSRIATSMGVESV